MRKKDKRLISFSFPGASVTIPACFVMFFLSSSPTFAKETAPEFEEIMVELRVEHLGSYEISAVIADGKDIYLPIAEVFDFLKIKCTPTAGIPAVNGFFIGEENTYTIDKQTNQIVYQKRTYPLEKDDLVYTASVLYLKLRYFTEVFGLISHFDFRNLLVSMRSESELPAVREKRLEKMRQNMLMIQKNYIADTIIGRSNKLFQSGALDWSVNSIQQVNHIAQNRLRLAFGATLAGGELRGNLNYNSNIPFSEQQQRYSWRYVNNDLSVLRQVVVGKIQTLPIATIINPVLGVQVSNVPTYRQTSFGTYSYSDYTEPGWTVELYINNVLVNYAKTDASGFFVFNIPLIYGNTEAVLRSYGPWGEEKVSRISFNIPFNFLPIDQFQYTVSAGIVQDGSNSRFAQLRMNYGVSRNLTIGGGTEYLSSVSSGTLMPFVNTSLAIKPNLLFTGEYTHNVRAKGSLNYLSRSNVQVELNYAEYTDAQSAVFYNFTRETGAVISKPLRIFNIPLYSRFTLARNSIQANGSTNIDFLLSGTFRSVSMNVSTSAFSRSETDLFVFSNISASLMLPAQIILNSLTRYAYNTNSVIFIQCGLKKNLFSRALLYATYERHFTDRVNGYQLGFAYNLPFARVDAASLHRGGTTIFSQGASGSVMHEPVSNSVQFTRNTKVSRGGVAISAFLDLNGNGRKDKTEPRVKGLTVKKEEGQVEKNHGDGITVIAGLEPYTYFFVSVDGSNFENIAWKIKQSSFRILIEPNMLKPIDVPVFVAGEASGKVYLQENDVQKGAGRIKVGFYDTGGKLVGSTVTESDGFFSYLGLSPGKYTAEIDRKQLEVLQLSCTSVPPPFTIRVDENGDVADELIFVLQKK